MGPHGLPSLALANFGIFFRAAVGGLPAAGRGSGVGRCGLQPLLVAGLSWPLAGPAAPPARAGGRGGGGRGRRPGRACAPAPRSTASAWRAAAARQRGVRHRGRAHAAVPASARPDRRHGVEVFVAYGRAAGAPGPVRSKRVRPGSDPAAPRRVRLPQPGRHGAGLRAVVLGHPAVAGGGAALLGLAAPVTRRGGGALLGERLTPVQLVGFVVTLGAIAHGARLPAATTPAPVSEAQAGRGPAGGRTAPGRTTPDDHDRDAALTRMWSVWLWGRWAG